MAGLTGPLTLQASADGVIEWRAFLLQCECPLLADFVAEVRCKLFWWVIPSL
jgi:hypothetical protein